MSKGNQKRIVATALSLREMLMKANDYEDAIELKEIILSKFQ